MNWKVYGTTYSRRTLMARDDQQPPLLEHLVTPRDWLARAWERLATYRAAHPDWTLDDALAHPGIGRVVRGFAAQIERDAKTVERHQQRARRYGQAVQHNGYGYAPVPAPTTTARRGKR